MIFFTFQHFPHTPIQLLKITIFSSLLQGILECLFFHILALPTSTYPVVENYHILCHINNLCFLLLLMSLYYEVFNLMMSITCTSKIEQDIL
jgi:hypothetical protein